MRAFRNRLVWAGLLAVSMVVGGCGDGDDGSFGKTDVPAVTLDSAQNIALKLPLSSDKMQAQSKILFKSSGAAALEIKKMEWVARPDRLVVTRGGLQDIRCTYSKDSAPTFDSSGACPQDSICLDTIHECRSTGFEALPITLEPGKSYSIDTLLLPGSELNCPPAPQGREVPRHYCGELLVETSANNTIEPSVEGGKFRIFFTHVQGSGQLQVDPPSLSFNGIAPGAVGSRDLTITNLHSEQPLVVESIMPRDYAQMIRVSPTPGLPATLAPSSSQTWTVTFSPPASWDGANFGTNLEILSSADPQNPKLVPVEVSAQVDLPAIKLEPAVLRFDTQTTQTLTVSNEGAARLTLRGVTASAQAAAFYTIAPVDPGASDVLRPGDTRDYTVTFTLGGDAAEGIGLLEVRYSYFVNGEGQNDSASVTLLGNAGDAAVGMLSPDSLDFRAEAGTKRMFALRNVGTQALTISAAEITTTAGLADAFSTTLSGGTTLAPGDVRAFEVSYVGAGEDSRAVLRLTSNSAGAELSLLLVAQAGDGSGAQAVITPGFGDDSLAVGTPGHFSALLSTGYDETTFSSAYWTLLGRPAGSTVFLDKIGPQATLIPDLAGTYKVLLVVGNGLNASQATYEFSAQ